MNQAEKANVYIDKFNSIYKLIDETLGKIGVTPPISIVSYFGTGDILCSNKLSYRILFEFEKFHQNPDTNSKVELTIRLLKIMGWNMNRQASNSIFGWRYASIKPCFKERPNFKLDKNLQAQHKKW